MPKKPSNGDNFRPGVCSSMLQLHQAGYPAIIYPKAQPARFNRAMRLTTSENATLLKTQVNSTSIPHFVSFSVMCERPRAMR
jgi:hypothetical protein